MIPLREHRVEHPSRTDRYRLWCVTDSHLGNRATDETALAATVREIEADADALWIAGGDKCEFINITDHRFDPRELASWIHTDDLSDLAQREAERYLELTKPIWGKCIASIDGNHERKIRVRYHFDIGGHIAAEMGVPYMGEDGAWIRLIFARQNGSIVSYEVLAHHGWGASRRASGIAGVLEEALRVFAADVILLGHVHRRDRVAVNAYAAGRSRVVTRRRVAVACGGFLDGASYAQRAGYPPAEIGAVCVELYPERRGIEVRL